MDSGNIGFVLLCAAFVFVMTPGLAMFYGGLVRKKNVVNTMMTSIFIIGIGIVMWVLFGYSLSFAPSGNAFIGDFCWLGLRVFHSRRATRMMRRFRIWYSLRSR